MVDLFQPAWGRHYITMNLGQKVQPMYPSTIVFRSLNVLPRHRFFSTMGQVAQDTCVGVATALTILSGEYTETIGITLS
jgi:hypothetical protein